MAKKVPGRGKGRGRRPAGAEAAGRRLREFADGERAKVLQRFFKTGPGEYGEGDRFLGTGVPAVRKTAKEFAELDEAAVKSLLRSPVHEERLLSLLIVVQRFRRGDGMERERLYRFYLAHTAWINNWDLVDVSAEHVVGAHLRERSRAPLRRLARSDSLWERRIAVMSTFHFVKRGDFEETLALAALLLGDDEDLIHKAVGWMLREVGNRDREAEEEFLRRHCRQMPRVMLRYAIEKFPASLRRRYLKGIV